MSNTPSPAPNFPFILPRIVPWASLEEWRFVKDAIYSTTTNSSDLSFALELGQVWRLRGKLPVAADATLNLKRLQVLAAGGNCDQVVLQLAMGSAILRMVNELTDPGQRGQYALPINRLAENIGLPRILVDIRHEATHDALSSFSTLGLGVEMALEWLYVNYWEPFSLLVLPEALRERIENVLEQISFLKGPDMEVNAKNAQRILTKEIEHIEMSGEKQAMLASVLMTPKWISSVTFDIIEIIMNIMNALSTFTFEFILNAISNESLINAQLIDRCTKLINHASFQGDYGSLSKVLHSLMHHISPPVLSVTKILFSASVITRDFFEQTQIYQQVVSAFMDTSAVPIVTSDQIEQVLELIEKEKQAPIKRGLVSGWKAIPLGCCPEYDPVKDGFYKQCYLIE